MLTQMRVIVAAGAPQDPAGIDGETVMTPIAVRCAVSRLPYMHSPHSATTSIAMIIKAQNG